MHPQNVLLYDYRVELNWNEMKWNVAQTAIQLIRLYGAKHDRFVRKVFFWKFSHQFNLYLLPVLCIYFSNALFFILETWWFCCWPTVSVQRRCRCNCNKINNNLSREREVRKRPKNAGKLEKEFGESTKKWYRLRSATEWASERDRIARSHSHSSVFVFSLLLTL